MELKTFYDRKEDVTLVECPQCSKSSQIDGTHEYGFFLNCPCGYTKTLETSGKMASQEALNIQKTVKSLSKHL